MSSQVSSLTRQSDSSRILELDVFRGWAALSVVMAHLSPDVLEGNRISQAISTPFDAGFGFRLFFIISGYVILMTLERCREPFDFVRSRFARLMPVYWFSVLFMFFLRGVENPEILSWERYPWLELLANLFMIPEFIGVPMACGVIWTLQVELVFYLAMLFILSVRWLGQMERVCLVVLSTAILFQLEWGASGFSQVWMEKWTRYAPYFVMGILFRLIRWRGVSCLRVGLLLLSVFVLGIQGELREALTGLALFGLMAAGVLKFICVTPFVFFGTISYSLYLIHNNLGLWLQRWMFVQTGSAWSAYLISMAAAVGVATVMTYRLDKPAGRWLRGALTTERLLYGISGIIVAGVLFVLGTRGYLIANERLLKGCAFNLQSLESTVEVQEGRHYLMKIKASGIAPSWVFLEGLNGWRSRKFKIEGGESQQIQVTFQAKNTGLATLAVEGEMGGAGKIGVAEISELSSDYYRFRGGLKMIAWGLMAGGVGLLCVTGKKIATYREEMRNEI